MVLGVRALKRTTQSWSFLIASKYSGRLLKLGSRFTRLELESGSKLVLFQMDFGFMILACGVNDVVVGPTVRL
ncbi:hypothetical protein Hanom_Chr05g00451191 [Helianthus anomalus]